MQPGELLNQRFEIERIAGSGGMGVVYRAIDRVGGGPVAIKVLTLGDGNRERFAREVEVLSRIDHPSVVRYVAHGTTPQGASYLAMEWLSGEDLAQRLERGPLGVEDALTVVGTIAAPLAVTHRQGIVHRDLKPSNVFLPEGPMASAKLLDFGIARFARDTRRLTHTGVIIGTPAYMAPEQARGDREIGPSADVFALGCVLFECIAGRTPFQGEHLIAVLAKIVFEDPPRLGEIVPGVPPSVEDLVARMLSKAPTARPKDAGEVLDALSHLDAGQSSARTAGAPERLTRGEQRVLCVVMAAPAGEIAATMLPAERRDVDDALRAAATTQGGKVEILANGAAVATFVGAASPTDEAARAASCALAMSAVLGTTPIAIVTGRAVVGDRVPVGEVIDRGARVLARGRAGGIAIDAVTEGLLPTRFVITGDEHDRMLVGERDDVSGVRQLLGKPTPCVGRDREIGALRAALAECIEEPAARAVLVSAAAGAGKSRVVHEFVREAQRVYEGIEVLFARGDSLAGGSAFAMVAEAIRRSAQIAPNDPVGTKLEKLRARVARYVPAGDRLRIAELLAELLSIPVTDASASEALLAARADPAAMGEVLRGALSEWIGAECRERPLLLVFEDLHWGDAPSIKLVESSLRALQERPFMFVATARPEVHTSFPELFSECGLQEIRLGTLARKASERLVREVLATASDETVQSLVDRAGGNPFFLEELVRAVAEGSDASALPDTVLGMLQARLDALGADAKRVLRAASVFGETFSQNGVVALLGGEEGARGSLDDLIEREILERRGSSTVREEKELGFRHALLRDAAYATLTDVDRTLGHRLAAEWLEASSADDQPDLLAYHFSRAGLWEKAVRHARRAAERAARLSRFTEAAHLLEQASAWALALPDDASRRTILRDVLLEQERCCENLGAREQQRQLIDRLVELLDTGDDPAGLAAVYVRQGELRAAVGAFDEGHSVLTRALDLSRSLGDTHGERAALRSIAFVCWQHGRNEESVTASERVLGLNQALGDRAGYGRDLFNLAVMLQRTGARDRARACFAESLTIEEANRRPFDEVARLNFGALLYGELGDYDAQLVCRKRALEISRAHGLGRYEVIALAAMASAACRDAPTDEGLALHHEVVARARELRLGAELARRLHGLADVLVRRARPREAIPHLVEAARALAPLGDREAEAAAWELLASAYEGIAEDGGAAMDAWEHAASLWRKAGRADRELDAALGVARVARELRRDDALAFTAYERAATLAHALGDAKREGDLLNTLGILDWSRQRYEAALGSYMGALAIYASRGELGHRALVLNSIGLTLKCLERFDEARARLHEAVETSREAREPLIEGHGLAVLGDVHLACKESDEATQCYEASLALRRAIGDRRGEGWMLHNLANVHAREGRKTAARDLASQAAAMASEQTDAELSVACERMLSDLG